MEVTARLIEKIVQENNTEPFNVIHEDVLTVLQGRGRLFIYNYWNHGVYEITPSHTDGLKIEYIGQGEGI